MDVSNLTQIFSIMGAAIAGGLGAIGPGIGIGHIGSEGVSALMRQKGASHNIIKMMLIGQAACGTPGIFALLIALILLFPTFSSFNLSGLVAFVSAGIAAGAGALGPGIGCGIVGAHSCNGVGKDPKADALILRTMLVAQAVAQTTSVYSLIVALILIYIV